MKSILIVVEDERINEIRVGLRALGWIRFKNEKNIPDDGIVDLALDIALVKIKEWIREEK